MAEDSTAQPPNHPTTQPPNHLTSLPLPSSHLLKRWCPPGHKPTTGPVMGIYDREYYRDDRSSFLGSLNRQGQVWKSLIAVNVVVFVAQLASAEHGGVRGAFTEALVVNTDAV